MRISIFLFALLGVVGCKQSISPEDLMLLNGYWEIQKVEFPDGQVKDYSFSSNIDYIEFENPKGFRKKVKPQLDGTYKTSDDAEPFTISSKEGTFLMVYGQASTLWEETLVSVKENTFTVRNSDQKTYYYARYQPLNLGQ
ncbi:MAG: lipocalin family protein [Croceivirga sp.]